MTTQVEPEAISNYIAMSHSQFANSSFRAKNIPYKIRNILDDRVLSERSFELLGAKHKDYQSYWRESLIDFSREVQDYKQRHKSYGTKEALRTALTRLDEDIAIEAYKYASPLSVYYTQPRAEVFKKTACSGCVGTLAVVKQGVCTLARVVVL